MKILKSKYVETDSNKIKLVNNDDNTTDSDIVSILV